MGLLIKIKNANFQSLGLGRYQDLATADFNKYLSSAQITDATQKQIATDLYNGLTSDGVWSKALYLYAPFNAGQALKYNMANVAKGVWTFGGTAATAQFTKDGYVRGDSFAYTNIDRAALPIAGGLCLIECNTTVEAQDGALRVFFGGNNGGAGDANLSLSRGISGNARVRVGSNAANNAAQIGAPYNTKVGFLGGNTRDWSTVDLWDSVNKVATGTGVVAPAAYSSTPLLVGAYWNVDHADFGSAATIAFIGVFKGLTDAEYIKVITRLKACAVALGITGASNF